MSDVPSSPPTQWSDTPTWLIVFAVLAAVGAVAAYMFGIPMLADAASRRIPAAAIERLSADSLAALDRQVFTPSALPRERQQQIESAFTRLQMPAGSSRTYRLVFRKSDAIGANALALPSGTIVVTDGLEALAKDDREILGVLAHEAGHVDRRHGLRGILQNSFVGLLVALVAGDVGSLAAAAPAALLEANYSRDLEREADAYAVQVLRVNRIPLRHLADMLRRLDTVSSGGGGTVPGLSYLSSHPATSERLSALEGE